MMHCSGPMHAMKSIHYRYAPMTIRIKNINPLSSHGTKASKQPSYKYA